MDVNKFKLVATLLPRLVEELKSATRDDNISGELLCCFV